MSIYIDTNDLCIAANGDWILEAYGGDEQTAEEFLLACFALILKQPDARIRMIRFMRGMADSFEREEARTEPPTTVNDTEKSARL